MGIDFYGVLQIPRKATDLEIKKAYKNLALEFRLDKLQSESTRNIFALISEAYDVLSDPFRRAIFDQYGEEGLKRGIPLADKYIEPYHYHGDPMRTYRDFFGTDSPYVNLFDTLNVANLKCDGEPKVKVQQKQPPIIHHLYLSLHEIFFGGIKKMKIHRLVYINAEKTRTEVKEKILIIPIKPGITPGTKIIFPEQGDQNPNQIPADVIFITEDRPHDYFTREENDLIMFYKVTLEESLMGTTVTVNTIDHRIIRIPITDIIFPGYEKIVENEGMPILDNYPRRGKLKIRFCIDFPRYLPRNCKEIFQKGFDCAKIAGNDDGSGTVNRWVLEDKMLRVDVKEQFSL